MDITSLLNGQLLSGKVSEHSKPAGKIDNTGTNSDHKKVAEEMESLFAYQLIKTMRETAESMNADKKSAGYDTYMSMFDMELSKLFASRGLGLQKSIINWLDRMPAANKIESKDQKND